MFEENIESIKSVAALADDLIQNYTKEEYDESFSEVWKEAQEAVSAVFASCCAYEEQVNLLVLEQEKVNLNLKIVDLQKTEELLDAVKQAADFHDAIYRLRQFSSYLTLPLGMYRLFNDTSVVCSEKIRKVLEYCLLEVDNEDFIKIAKDIIKTGEIQVFPTLHDFQEKKADCAFDEEKGMWYAWEAGKRMYFPGKQYDSMEDFEHAVKLLHMEQSPQSPHRYLNERMEVPEGAVVMDAGSAEGNFSLSVIDKVKKLYLIETDPAFVKALQETFKDYLDKVVIVNKFLSDKSDENNITIDEIMQGEPLDYIKMDIEGAEISALKGAKETLSHSPDLKCNICVYHRFHDNERITGMLEQMGFEVENTQGYMMFPQDPEYPYYPRRGLIQAVKRMEG